MRHDTKIYNPLGADHTRPAVVSMAGPFGGQKQKQAEPEPAPPPVIRSVLHKLPPPKPKPKVSHMGSLTVILWLNGDKYYFRNADATRHPQYQ